MPKPKVIGQPTSTEHLTLGINALADLLAPTLGPIGGIVANQRDHMRRPELLDNSATTVRRILNMGDPRADVGAMLMRSTIWRVVQRAGDGGATAAVLARAIYADAVRLIAAGANAMQLAKGINEGVRVAVAELKEQARPVTHENELAAVALTVIREPALAAVLGEMSYLLGPDAHVTIEKYVASYLQQFYYPGANYRAQIASMYFYTDPIHKRAVLPSGYIALVDGKLEQTEQIVALLDATLKAGGKALTVVAGQFSDQVISVMMANNQTNSQNKNGQAAKLMLVGVKPKDVGDARRAAFDDLALLTGAAVLERGWSKPAAHATLSDLGKVLRVEVDAEVVHVVPEKQQTAETQAKIAELRAQLAQMTLDDEDRPNLIKRLSALSGGMGVLKIGAEGKLEREVLTENAERVLKVLSAAQHSGVAPGGGAAYLHCIPSVAKIQAEEDTAFGVQIVQRALAAPIRQILDNAHAPSSSVIIDRIQEAGPNATYDVIQERVVDAFETGILDVTDVLCTVLQTAASGALMALTTDTIVYHKKPKESMTP
jgi:chaperonin GroEL